MVATTGPNLAVAGHQNSPSAPEDDGSQRRRQAAGVMCLGALAWLVLFASPAAGQDPAPTVSGDTITGSYSSANSQPFFEGGYQLPADLLANVAAISCSSGGTASLTGGPGGSPECVFSSGVTSASLIIKGHGAWPSTFVVTPFWSYNNRDYSFGSPVTVTSPSAPTPAPQTPATPAPQTPATPAPALSPQSSSISSSNDWIWWTLGGIGVVAVGTGAYVATRDGSDGDGHPSSPDAADSEKTPDIGFAHGDDDGEPREIF